MRLSDRPWKQRTHLLGGREVEHQIGLDERLGRSVKEGDVLSSVSGQLDDPEGKSEHPHLIVVTLAKVDTLDLPSSRLLERIGALAVEDVSNQGHQILLPRPLLGPVVLRSFGDVELSSREGLQASEKGQRRARRRCDGRVEAVQTAGEIIRALTYLNVLRSEHGMLSIGHDEVLHARTVRGHGSDRLQSLRVERVGRQEPHRAILQLHSGGSTSNGQEPSARESGREDGRLVVQLADLVGRDGRCQLFCSVSQLLALLQLLTRQNRRERLASCQHRPIDVTHHQFRVVGSRGVDGRHGSCESASGEQLGR